MSLKILQPGSNKLSRQPSHSVRFTSDEMPKYKSLDSPGDMSLLSLTGVSTFNTAPDSGAPSPDFGPMQPAAQRFKVNEQRIKLLLTINQIVQQRAELESNRTTLTNLLDELRKKLKRKIEECHFEKKEKMKALKQANQRLEKEKFTVSTEIEHLKRHLEKEEAHHVQHARTAAAQTINGIVSSNNQPYVSCSISQIPTAVSRNVARNAPSKISDNKLVAARLMRDIAELRQRVAQVEARLANELKRKRQAELDIARLRKELSNTKSSVASLRLPPQPLRKQCSRFA